MAEAPPSIEIPKCFYSPYYIRFTHKMQNILGFLAIFIEKKEATTQTLFQTINKT